MDDMEKIARAKYSPTTNRPSTAAWDVWPLCLLLAAVGEQRIHAAPSPTAEKGE